jgi:hypothetical protein
MNGSHQRQVTFVISLQANNSLQFSIREGQTRQRGLPKRSNVPNFYSIQKIMPWKEKLLQNPHPAGEAENCWQMGFVDGETARPDGPDARRSSTDREGLSGYKNHRRFVR